MRTPAMIRWPGTITAEKVTDEIIADLDWYPTIAHLIGEENRIPADPLLMESIRPISCWGNSKSQTAVTWWPM